MTRSIISERVRARIEKAWGDGLIDSLKTYYAYYDLFLYDTTIAAAVGVPVSEVQERFGRTVLDRATNPPPWDGLGQAAPLILLEYELEDIPNLAYRAVLQREPDKEGLSYWRTYLHVHQPSRLTFFKAFLSGVQDTD